MSDISVDDYFDTADKVIPALFNHGGPVNNARKMAIFRSMWTKVPLLDSFFLPD